MIAGTHALIYSDDPEATRAFLRDVLDLSWVDAHGGWLIFALPPAEVGIHPTGESAGAAGVPAGRHEVWLMCHDVQSTVAELEAKGVEFTKPVEEAEFGVTTEFRLPGAGTIGLYEPRHASPLELFQR